MKPNTPKRSYRRTAPYVRDKSTINTSGLRSSNPPIDINGETQVFPLFKVSNDFAGNWQAFVTAYDQTHAIMSRLAIHEVNRLTPSQVRLAVDSYNADDRNQASFVRRFRSFKVHRTSLDAFQELCIDSCKPLPQVARMAFDRLIRMPPTEVSNLLTDYLNPK